jgi:MFS family permease
MTERGEASPLATSEDAPRTPNGEGARRAPSGFAPSERSVRSLAGIPIDSLLLGLTTFSFISATNILTPLLPEIRDDLDISITTAGLVVGSYGLARLAIDLPAGFLADAVGHRRLSIVAVLVLIGSSLLGFVAGNVETLIASRVLSGIAAGALATVVLSAMTATASPANRGRVLSVIGLANNSGVTLYPLLGALIGAVVGWRPTFLVTAVLAAGAGLILLRQLNRIQPGRAGRGRGDEHDSALVLQGRRKQAAVVATNAGVVAVMIHRAGLRNTILPLYAATVLGLGGVSIASGLAIMAAVALLVTTPGGMAGDRFGRRRIIVAGLTGVAVADLAFLATHDLATFLIVCAVVGLGDLFSATQTALLTDVVPATERTRTLSGYRFSSDLGAMIGPIILAATMDTFDARAAIILAVVILGTAALATWRFVPATVDAERIRRLAA